MQDPENQKAVGGFRKYLAGKCCVHSELSPHDPGKINLCGGKRKETKRGGLSRTPPSVSEHRTPQLCWWGEDFERGLGGALILFHGLEDYSLTGRYL